MGIFGWDGDHSARSSKPPKAPKPPKSGGGGGKKSGGGLCIQIAPFAAVPALLSLVGAIAASLIG